MSKSHVETALQVLQAIYDAIGPAYMPYFMTPNALLGVGQCRPLSGARIESPEHRDTEALEVAIDVLGEYDFACQLTDDTLAADGTPYTKVEFLSIPRISELPATRLLPLAEPAETTPEGVRTYVHDTMNRFDSSNGDAKPGANGIGLDWFVGLLYGYPEPAVAAMPPFWEFDYGTRDAFEERVHDAEIDHAMDYFETSDGACVYQYPWFLEDHPDILQHQEQWSQYLDDVYASGWHEQILRDEAFQATLQHAREHDAGAPGGGKE